MNLTNLIIRSYKEEDQELYEDVKYEVEFDLDCIHRNYGEEKIIIAGFNLHLINNVANNYNSSNKDITLFKSYTSFNNFFDVLINIIEINSSSYDTMTIKIGEKEYRLDNSNNYVRIKDGSGLNILLNLLDVFDVMKSIKNNIDELLS